MTRNTNVKKVGGLQIVKVEKWTVGKSSGRNSYSIAYRIKGGGSEASYETLDEAVAQATYLWENCREYIEAERARRRDAQGND